MVHGTGVLPRCSLSSRDCQTACPYGNHNKWCGKRSRVNTTGHDSSAHQVVVLFRRFCLFTLRRLDAAQSCDAITFVHHSTSHRRYAANASAYVIPPKAPVLLEIPVGKYAASARAPIIPVTNFRSSEILESSIEQQGHHWAQDQPP